MISKRYERYVALIKEFPLMTIRDEESCKQAKLIIERLDRQAESDRVTNDEQEYKEVLQKLVADFEEPKKKMMFTELNPHQALLRLMREHDVSQSELIEISGDYKSNVSAFLSGKRNITRSVAQKLADYFNVSPELFAPKMDMGSWVTIYCDGGIFDGLFAVKIVIDNLNSKLKTGKYELEPFSYKAPVPPYRPVYVWLPKLAPAVEDNKILKQEIEESYREITQYAHTYHPNNLEERRDQCSMLISRL